MTKKEIFDIESVNHDRIYLFLEGNFWKAYEKSAFAFITQVKAYRPIKKYIKIIAAELVSIGFPFSALEQLGQNLETAQQTDKRVVLNLSAPIDTEAFEEWKTLLPITETNHNPKNNIAYEETIKEKRVDTLLVEKIKNFDIAELSGYTLNKAVEIESIYMNNDKNSIFKSLWELRYPQRWDLLWVFGFCALLMVLDACVQPSPKTKQSATTLLTLPEIPSTLTSAAERADYLVLHYWDNFDFSDTTLIGSADITEQELVNYINLFPQTSLAIVERSISVMLDSALSGSREMFDHFAELYEKYLYDPNSPFRQEDYYIAVLQAVITNERVDELAKIRPQYLLSIALMNRPGDMAADFEYTVSNGQRSYISRIKTDYLILFFNNPDCHDCARVKEYLGSSSVVDVMMKTNSRPSLRIVAVYPDEDIELWKKTEYPPKWINCRSSSVREEHLYDLKAIPTLYLLDKEKRVILKDAPVEIVEQWLSENRTR